MRGIDDCVEYVHEEVHEDEYAGDEQDNALDDRIVATQDGVDEEPSQPSYGKHVLGDHGAVEKDRERNAHDRNHGDQTVSERVSEYDHALAHTLGVGSAYVVLREDLKHGRAGLTRENRAEAGASRERGQDQLA